MPAFIEEYLVGLGFEVKQPELAKFQSVLKLAEGSVGTFSGKAIADILKFQIAVTGAFAAAGFGVIGYIDKLAMSDQQQRLFAQRSFMTLQQARGVKTALDVLGVSVEDVSWDRELHDRFERLIADQKQLSIMVGPSYEKQMKEVRDVQFQLQRLEVKGTYFGMKFASDLLSKLGLGDGGIEKSLEHLNDYVLKNMPQWSAELSTDFLPVLHDFWDIMKGLGRLTQDVALEFTNLVGVFSKDTSIQGSTFDFHKFATAVERVAHWLAVVVEKMVQVEEYAVRFAPVIAGIVGGAAVGGGVGLAAGGVGAVPGAAIGATLGGIVGAGVMLKENEGRNAGTTTGPNGNLAETARIIAKEVSVKTGIDASLIYGQLAHETGNFTNRGSTSLNNFAGIRYPGTTTYQKYDTPEAFADYYAKVLSGKRYGAAIANAPKTPEGFAHALKHPGDGTEYYEGPEDVYAKQLRYFSKQYTAPSSPITIGTINIPINNPKADAHEIHAAVKSGIRDAMGERSQRDMAELAGAY